MKKNRDLSPIFRTLYERRVEFIPVFQQVEDLYVVENEILLAVVQYGP